MGSQSNAEKYRESFKIRSSEVYPSQKVKLSSLCNLMQEVAGNHARVLDFDIMSLREQKLTWVLHRLHFQIDKYPKWRDEITIETWPSSGDALRAYRDFRLTHRKGNEFGRALSYWVMLNTNTRRPVRMPEQVLNMAPKNISHVIEVNTDRIELPEPFEFNTTFTVRKGDLDVNEHVNNVKYIEWSLETVDDPSSIRNMNIEFRSECRYGDRVLAGSFKHKNGISFALQREDSGELVSVARSLEA